MNEFFKSEEEDDFMGMGLVDELPESEPKLIIFDFKTKTKEEVRLLEFLKINLDITDDQRLFGLQLYAKLNANAERIVNSYYRKCGYRIAKCWQNKKNFKRDQFVAPLKAYFKKKDTSLNILWSVGVPDYLVYKVEDSVVKDLFFVEVKSQLDGLKMEQARWLVENDFKVLVVFVVK